MLNLRLKLLTLILASLSATAFQAIPANAQEATSPIAITSVATDYQQPGRFIWADLTTHDSARASDFYSQVFGWNIVKVDDQYSMAFNNGQPVAGIAQLAVSTEENTQWLGFIASNDTEEIADYSRQNGGTVLMEPREISGRGSIAVLADPEGAIFGILQSEFGEPYDHDPAYNEWVWQELWADNTRDLSSFYTKAGYQVIDNEMTETPEDLILVAGNYSRAGIVKKTDPSIDSAWLLYLRVENLAKTRAKIEELGGELLSAAGDGQSAYPVGIFADNTGGIFAAIEWQPTEEDSL